MNALYLLRSLTTKCRLCSVDICALCLTICLASRASEVGPVSLVGLLSGFNNPSDLLAEFNLTDGTGRVQVKVDLPAESDKLLQELQEASATACDQENPQLLTPVRVVGICEPALTPEGCITIRAIHVRRAHRDEYAFYHVILTATEFIKYARKTSTLLPPQEELPSRFKRVTKPCERFVLSVILRQREADLGLCRKALLQAGKTAGFVQDDLMQAIADLDAAGHLLVIDDTGTSGDDQVYLDVMPANNEE